MKLNEICGRLALNIFSKPGTRIQCMNNIDSIHQALKIGETFTVREAMNNTCLDLEGMPQDNAFYLARMFRKAA